MRGRLTTSLLVLCAIGVFGAAVYVVRDSPAVPGAGQLVSSAPLSSATRAGNSADSSASSAHGPLLVAFLGDDYTSGKGAGVAFPGLLGTALQVTVKTFALDGGGYAQEPAYASKLDALAAARPDVVIVTGGRNDVADYTPTLKAATTQLFARLHARLPAAKLIAVQPFWGDSPAPADLSPVAAAVRTGVGRAGGTYLALDDPLRGHPSYMADAADPNDTGQHAIATALQPRLESLLPG